MGNCKDCKWWNAEPYVIEKGWRVCELTRISDDRRLHDSLAIVQADYVGDLMTSPDFGCVQFEQQEKT